MLEILLIAFIAGPAALGQSLFVYRYAKYTAWRETKVGQVLMVKSTTLCLLVVVAFLNELLAYTGVEWVLVTGELTEIVAYLLITIAIWWQLFTLIRVQNQKIDVDIPAK